MKMVKLKLTWEKQKSQQTATWVIELLHGHVILTNLDHSMKLAFDDSGKQKRKYEQSKKRGEKKKIISVRGAPIDIYENSHAI